MLELFNDLRGLNENDLNRLCSLMTEALLPFSRKQCSQKHFEMQTPEEVVQDIMIKHIVERKLPEEKLEHGFEHEGDMLAYFRRIILRHILKKLERRNIEQPTDYNDENLGAQLNEHDQQIELFDLVPDLIDDLLDRFQRFRAFNSFCYNLLERRFYTNPEEYGIRGMPILEMIDTWPNEYGHFSVSALERRLSRCKNYLRKF